MEASSALYKTILRYQTQKDRPCVVWYLPGPFKMSSHHEVWVGAPSAFRALSDPSAAPRRSEVSKLWKLYKSHNKVLLFLSLSSEKQNSRIWNDLDNMSSLNSWLRTGLCRVAMTWFSSVSQEGCCCRCPLASCHGTSHTASRYPPKSPRTFWVLAFL